VKAHGSGAAALTFEGWRQAAAAWLAATKGEEETDVSQLLTNISALPTKASRIAKDLRQPIEVSVRGVHSERDVWQTVFGYMTPADEYDGRTTYARADLAQRTYCLLLDERQGDSHGYVAAVEKDFSYRLLVLEDGDGSCDELIPFSSRYLPDTVLQDCLGDMMNCTTCFGLTEPSQGTELSCPSCGVTGRLPVDKHLRQATYQFIDSLPATKLAPAPSGMFGSPASSRRDWGGRIKVFTSQALRQHLADVVQSNEADALDPS
jgi:hypothetical protein